ncbi:MAG: DNA polymerase I, partial [Actinomycetia bacterium]|nr:DNA polymerase I [Actinomycetes bacterium]
EFQTLLKRLEIKEEKPLKVKEPVSLKIVKIQSEQELNNWVDKIIKKGEVGISIQTEGGILDGGVLSLTIGLSENEIGFVPLDGFNKAFFTPTLNQLLTSKDVIKIIYDLKNIYHFLSNSDIELTPPFFDVLLASYLLHPDRGKYSFNSLIEFYSGLEINKTEKEEKHDLSCSLLFPLYSYLNKELKKGNLMDVFKQIEIPLSPILAKMEKRGVRINPEIFFSLSKEIEKLLQKVEEDIYGLAGTEFNINSPQQVSKVLFEKLKLETGKKRKKAYATDFSALIKIASSHPIIDKILTFRELSKLKTTYLDVLPGLVNKKTGRIHTDFKITGTATGRLSSVNPNLQNIPVRGRWANRIREGFIPEEGNILISCDYSQIDLRVLAHLSGDKNLLDAFQNNLDIHVATASEVFSAKKDKVDQKMRRAAKAVNFGIVYGISPFGLAEQLKIEQDEAKEYIEKYFKRYPEVKEYIKNIIAEGYQNGFVSTLFGRRRYLPQLKSANEKIKNFGERLAVNSPIQGTSADLIKMAMIEIFKKFKKEMLKAEMILQVHDELIFESPLEEKKKVIKITKEVMEKIYPLKSGLSVSVSSGNNWAELSKK